MYHICIAAVGGTLSCDPLMTVGEIIIAIGVFALITALCCSMCSYMVRSASPVADGKEITEKEVFILCCFVVSVPLIVFLGLLIGESVLIAENYEVVRNGTYVNDDGELVTCENSEIPFILSIIAWVLLLLLCCRGCLPLCHVWIPIIVNPKNK